MRAGVYAWWLAVAPGRDLGARATDALRPSRAARQRFVGHSRLALRSKSLPGLVCVDTLALYCGLVSPQGLRPLVLAP